MPNNTNKPGGLDEFDCKMEMLRMIIKNYTRAIELLGKGSVGYLLIKAGLYPDYMEIAEADDEIRKLADSLPWDSPSTNANASTNNNSNSSIQ